MSKGDGERGKEQVEKREREQTERGRGKREIGGKREEGEIGRGRER